MKNELERSMLIIGIFHFRFKKAIERYSKVGPQDRCSRIQDFVSNFRKHEKVYEKLQEWAMDFNNEPAGLDGRVLQMETLMFGNSMLFVDRRFDINKMQKFLQKLINN